MQHEATNKWLITASALAIGGLLSAGPVLAQVPAQPIPLERVDVQKMASGYRVQLRKEVTKSQRRCRRKAWQAVGEVGGVDWAFAFAAAAYDPVRLPKLIAAAA